MELMDLKTRHEEILSGIKKVEGEIEETDKRIRFMESAFAYEDVLSARKEKALLKAQLETLSKKKDEIDAEYQSCIFHAKILLEEEMVETGKTIEKLRNELDLALNEQDIRKKKLKEKDEERDSVLESLASVSARLEDVKEKHSTLTSYFVKDMTVLVDPAEGLVNYKKEKEILSGQVKTLHEEIEKSNRTMEDLSISETRIKETLALLSQKKENVEEEINNHENRLSQ
jgi:chromosome segregation ATPase